MEERAEGLQKIAATHDAEELAPGTAIGMAIRAQVPPSYPAAVCTGRIGTEVAGGVDLAAAPARHNDTRRGCGGVWARGAGVCTGIAGGRVGEAGKGCGLTAAP
jgi:hypothetical protein